VLHQATLSERVQRPTSVTIDLTAIAHNFHSLRQITGDAKMMCILKANAYGHGLIRIATFLEKLGADYFGVAYLEEGIMLREAGIKTPILVMGGIIGDQIPLFLEYDLTITASSVDKLHLIEACARELNKEAKVHLKIDTGMERIGIHYYNADSLIEASFKCKYTIIEGIFSHLANADEGDDHYSKLQIERFNKVLDVYSSNAKRPKYIHLSNSAGIVSLPSAKYNMARVGIMLYGISPSASIAEQTSLDLQPALSWTTRVVYFKVVKPDHPVSYGSNWSTSKLTRIITLPVGYGDGYMRAMSGKAQIMLHGKKYPVVGNICMDQMMVDIGWDSGYNGDKVYLIGGTGENAVAVENLAEWAGTIPYEILTNINTRVPRRYINDNSLIT
jgi:alanine racemase